MSLATPTNAEFLQQHAATGRIGLAGGSALVDLAIRRVQRAMVSDGESSPWSHAFLFSGERADGQHWVLESDLAFEHKQIRLGVQENRISKYFDESAYPNLAVLDFALSAAQTRTVMTEALDLLAGLHRYSLREIVGTLLALKSTRLRQRQNLLAQTQSLYCSALVQQCYQTIGIEFTPGVYTKNITPQDIAGTTVAHRAMVLQRP